MAVRPQRNTKGIAWRIPFNGAPRVQASADAACDRMFAAGGGLCDIWKCQDTSRASSKNALYWSKMGFPRGYKAASVGLSGAKDPQPSRMSWSSHII
jgi:hypothetical protein